MNALDSWSGEPRGKQKLWRLPGNDEYMPVTRSNIMLSWGWSWYRSRVEFLSFARRCPNTFLCLSHVILRSILWSRHEAHPTLLMRKPSLRSMGTMSRLSSWELEEEGCESLQSDSGALTQNHHTLLLPWVSWMSPQTTGERKIWFKEI